MGYDNKLIISKMRVWEGCLENFILPEWDAIPNIGLYMEQVTALLKQYINYLPPEAAEELCLTGAAVNNYVRRKMMPEPIRKKYYRKHIAYLIIICTLKQSLSMATIQQLVPGNMSDEETASFYTSYINRCHMARKYFIEQVKLAVSGIVGKESSSSALCADSAEDIIAAAAVVSGFARLLAENLLLLNNQTSENES